MAIKGRRENNDMETPLLSNDSFVLDLRRAASNTTSQVAIIGAELSPIESLDYELVENDLFKQDWRSRSRAHILQYVLLKWAFCFLVGALAGGIGFLTNLAVENVAGIKFVVTSNMMLAQRYGWAFGVFMASNFMLTMFAAGITVFFAPEAAGSGIPEVKAYLNGVDAPGIFSLRTLVVKVIGTIAAVSSSLHIGKAGPLVHTGACIASILSQGGSRKHHLTWKWLGYFKNDRDRRDLVTCGAGAGIAAAFRAPVGGVLFALEAVSSWWRISLLWRAFFTTAVVAVILRALIDVCKSGKCGLFGKGGLIMFDVTSDSTAYLFSDLLPVIVLGVIGGILGSFYNFLLIKLLRVYTLINEYLLLSYLCYNFFLSCAKFVWEFDIKSFEKNSVNVTKYLCLCTHTSVPEVEVPITVHVRGWCVKSIHFTHTSYDLSVVDSNCKRMPFLVPVLVYLVILILFKFFEFCLLRRGRVYKLLLAATLSIFTSCCLFGLPWLAACKPCPADAAEACPSIGRSGNYKKYQCAPGHYNDLASLFFNTNDDTIRNLYSAGTDNVFQPSSIIIFFVASYFLGIFSYGIAAPSGLFVPVILTGATYGRLIGMLMGSYSSLDLGLFAVLGSASLLGGSMRITVSVCVILLELTNNLLLLPLVMLVLLISKTVADAFNANIYDLLVKLKGFPYLEAHAEPYMRQLTVADVVTGPLQVFNGVEKVGNIVHVLRTSGHNGFPVVDEPPFSDSPVLYGLILRAHLIVLLKKKEFLHSCVHSGFDTLKQFCADDFAKRGSMANHELIEDLKLSEEEMEMYVDLHPFTNTSPYTVVETMSLAKALILFREVGLRHLLVIPKSTTRTPVVGILTRHDFMPEHILGLHPFLLKKRWWRLRLGKFDFLKLYQGVE